MKLSELFDGEIHFLEPGVDFVYPGENMVIGFEELDEDEPLGPYESPATAPIMGEHRGSGFWLKDEDARERHQIEMAWGSLSIALSTLMRIVGGSKEQYQHRMHDGSPDTFSFKLKKFDGEWQGGPL